jgi:hypothetical protein
MDGIVGDPEGPIVDTTVDSGMNHENAGNETGPGLIVFSLSKDRHNP